MYDYKCPKNFPKMSLQIHKNDQEYLKKFKIYSLQRQELIEIYFNEIKDEKFYKEIVELYKKDQSQIDTYYVSLYRINKILGKKIDKNDYKFEECPYCKLPSPMVEDQLQQKLDEFQKDHYEKMVKEFDKGNYQESLKYGLGLEYNDKNIKYIIDSFVKLKRINEAIYFINISTLDKNEKLKLLKKVPLKIEEKKIELHKPDFDLKNNQIQYKDFSFEEFEMNGNISMVCNPFYAVHQTEKGDFILKIHKDEKTIKIEEDRIFDELDMYQNGFYYKNGCEYKYYNIEKNETKVFKKNCFKMEENYHFDDKVGILKSRKLNSQKKQSCLIIKNLETFEILDIYYYTFLSINSYIDHYIKNNLLFLFSREYHGIVFTIDLKTGYLINIYFIELKEKEQIIEFAIDDYYYVVSTNIGSGYCVYIFDKQTSKLISKKIFDRCPTILLHEYLFLSREDLEENYLFEIYIPLNFEKVVVIETEGLGLIPETFTPFIKDIIMVLNGDDSGQVITIPIENDKRIRSCENCEKKMVDIKPKICGRCFQVSYCSKECQVENWKKHKFFCNLLK